MAPKRKPIESAQPQKEGKSARNSVVDESNEKSTGTKRKNNQNSAAELVISTSEKKLRSSSTTSEDESTFPPTFLRRSSRSSSGGYDDKSDEILSEFTGDSPSNSTIGTGHTLPSPLSTTPRTKEECQKDQHRRNSHYRTLLDVATLGGSSNARLTQGFFDELKALHDPTGGFRIMNGDVALIDIPDKKENYTPLIYAARNNNSETCRLLVELGGASIDMNAGWNAATALMKAAEKGTS